MLMWDNGQLRTLELCYLSTKPSFGLPTVLSATTLLVTDLSSSLSTWGIDGPWHFHWPGSRMIILHLNVSPYAPFVYVFKIISCKTHLSIAWKSTQQKWITNLEQMQMMWSLENQPNLLKYKSWMSDVSPPQHTNWKWSICSSCT